MAIDSSFSHKISSVTSLAAFLFLATSRIAAGAQSIIAPGLFITPSATVLVVGGNAGLSAVDETGRPVSEVQWSISPSVADLREENREVFVVGKEAGRTVLTATANGRTASAAISVVTAEKLVGGTVRWSLQPMPGFQTLLVMQAVPTAGGPAFYSIEWSKTENAIVRALSESGQQMWMTQLASGASPLTLRQHLPEPGQIFENDVQVSDHSTFIIGPKVSYAVNQATNPSSYGLPADGKSILLRASGDDSGGIVLLERGRFRDFLVDLNPANGSDVWRYHSEGRLAKNWTVSWDGDVGIVETLPKPASSALLILNARTGKVRFRIPFPISSSTVDGFKCKDPKRNMLKSIRPSRAGSVFTSNDGNMYVQVETHVESVVVEECKNKQYSFDDTLALLRVTPEGETDWKSFQHSHADGAGNIVPQPRVFAGETIPDGFGGVLAAWTYLSPDDSGGKLRADARLSRIGPAGQRDFILPMAYWTEGLNSPFDENMVLGEGNFLYAVNGPLLVRFDTQSGEVNWVRHPPTGKVKLDHSTAGGGVLVSNAGRLVYFDAQGNGVPFPWTVQVSNPENIGLVQTDLFDGTPLDALQLRDAQFCWAGNYIAVEDGAPYGHGALLYFLAK